MKIYSVTLESSNHGMTEPVASMDVWAANARGACKAAARLWGLRPHEWCFENSPYLIQASASLT